MPMAASSECDIYAGEVRYTTRATPSDHALRCSCCAERLMRRGASLGRLLGECAIGRWLARRRAALRSRVRLRRARAARCEGRCGSAACVSYGRRLVAPIRPCEGCSIEGAFWERRGSRVRPPAGSDESAARGAASARALAAGARLDRGVREWRATGCQDCMGCAERESHLDRRAQADDGGGMKGNGGLSNRIEAAFDGVSSPSTRPLTASIDEYILCDYT